MQKKNFFFYVRKTLLLHSRTDQKYRHVEKTLFASRKTEKLSAKFSSDAILDFITYDQVRASRANLLVDESKADERLIDRRRRPIKVV